jgi:signal transduction histidine kinase
MEEKHTDLERTARSSRRWALGIVAWLLVVPLALAVVRTSAPSDHLPTVPPSGDSSALLLAPARPVAGIRAGDRLVAIDGHPVADVIRSSRSRKVRVGEQLVYVVDHDGVERAETVTVRARPEARTFLPSPSDAGNLVVDLILLGLGVWLAMRRPHDLAAHALLVLGAAVFVSNALPPPLLEPLDLWARPTFVGAAIAGLGAYTVSGISILLFACAFPTPVPRFARHPWTAAAAVPLVALVAVGVAFTTGHGSLGLYRASGFVAERIWEMCAAAGLAILAVRWRRSRRDALARRRLGLVGIGFGLTFGLSLVAKFFQPVPLAPAGYFVALAFFPVALVVAIVKDDLFELNAALNRGLVALVVGVALLALYLAAVGATAALTGAGGPLVALPAAGLVAVVFAPLRDAVRRLVGHRLFGIGGDPRLVFHRLATRLAASDDPESLMAAVAETATESLRLPYVAVELRAGDEWRTVEERGHRPPLVETFEIVSGESVVGRLVAAPRRDVKVLSPSDRQLLNDLAGHSRVAARVAGLLTELRAAQQRLLVAREAERDRVHRDLHDSIGPSLVGLTLQLEVAAELAGDSQLAKLISRLHAEAARATEDVRRLVRDLRPADLDELGLPAAVAAAAARLRSPNGPEFDLDTPTRLPELSKEVEDTAYKICLEAMTNAVRHSGARRCAVRLHASGDEAIEVEIADDGTGMAGDESGTGTGMRSMRERAAAVGGSLRIESDARAGTRILAQLPVRAAR